MRRHDDGNILALLAVNFSPSRLSQIIFANRAGYWLVFQPSSGSIP